MSAECALAEAPWLGDGWDPFGVGAGVLSPRARVLPSAWVGSHVWIPGKMSVTGVTELMDVGLTPYLVEPLDAIADLGVRRVTIKAGTQLGKTLCMYGWWLWSVVFDPGSCAYVMPDEKVVRKAALDRIIPMMRLCGPVWDELDGSEDDTSAIRISFSRMMTYFVWANSPAAMASFPLRRVLFDEASKFPALAGKEASPVKLASERTKNFWNSFMGLVSSPKALGDATHTSYEKSDRRKYWMPCPHCHAWQWFQWKQVKFPQGERDPEKIRLGRLAWYECARCGERIEDRHKSRMLRDGVWVPGAEEDDVESFAKRVRQDREAEEERRAREAWNVSRGRAPRDENFKASSHRGYWLNSIYSPWLTFSDVAGEFLESEQAEDRIPALMNFTNSWLAEEWVEKTGEITLESVSRLQLAYCHGEVPEDAVVVLGGADVQADRIYYVVRAFGYEEQSWLIDWGCVVRPEPAPRDWSDFDGLEQECLARQYSNGKGLRFQVYQLAIDRRHRTDEVDKFARRHGERVHGVMGSEIALPGALAPYRLERDSQGKSIAGGLVYHRVNTVYYKDLIVRQQQAESPTWHVYAGVEDEYMRQMSSEQKVLVRRPRGKVTPAYVKKPGHPDNHLWDCEVYVQAALDLAGLRGELQRARPMDMGGTGRREGLRTPDGRAFLVTQR